MKIQERREAWNVREWGGGYINMPKTDHASSLKLKTKKKLLAGVAVTL